MHVNLKELNIFFAKKKQRKNKKRKTTEKWQKTKTTKQWPVSGQKKGTAQKGET